MSSEIVAVNAMKLSTGPNGHTIIDYHYQIPRTTNTPITTSSTPKSSDGANGFDILLGADWTYWAILVAFLLIGCCFGGCCWWYSCLKFRQWLEQDTYSYSAKLSLSSQMNKLTNTGTQSEDEETLEMPPGDPMMQKMTSTPNPNTDTESKMMSKPRPRRAQTVEMQHIARQDEGSGSEGNQTDLDTVKDEIEIKDPVLTAEERRKQRERYIEYGSDYDSSEERKSNLKSKRRKKKKRKARKRRKSPAKTVSKSPNSNRSKYGSSPSVGSTDSERVAGRVVSIPDRYDKSSDSDSENKPRKKTRNKRTGTLEPDRYDSDGQRILSTKELLAKYKKQKAKPDIELTYKVGAKANAAAKAKPDNEINEAASDCTPEPVRRGRRTRHARERSGTLDETDLRSKSQRKRAGKFGGRSLKEPRRRRPRSARYSDVNRSASRSRRSYQDSDSDESS